MADVEGYKVEIRRSFALVEPIAITAASIFYPTLWEVNPETKVRDFAGLWWRSCVGFRVRTPSSSW